MVRSYPIDESLVTRAVQASGNQPVSQVFTQALEAYIRSHHHPPAPPSPSISRRQAINEWLAETAALPKTTD
jgi:hypothetical protein